MKKKAIITVLLLAIFILSAYYLASANFTGTGSSNLKAQSGSQLNESQKTSGPKAAANNFSSKVLNGDTLLQMTNGYYSITTDSGETKIETTLPSLHQYQIVLSDDCSKLYYNTLFTGTEGHLLVYDIEKKVKYDLLESLGINIDDHVSIFTYNNNKIYAIIGKIQGYSDIGYSQKRETNKLLEINLKDNSYSFMSLPFEPVNASQFNGLAVCGQNYFISYTDYLPDNKSVQKFVIVDKQGKIINELPVKGNNDIYNILLSPDGKKFVYQLDQSPANLYLYDIENNRTAELFNSEKALSETGIRSSCIYSSWSKKDDIIYFILDNNVKVGSDNRYSLVRFNIKEMRVDE